MKSGGHALTQGYSSTLGVQISMSKFSTILYDEDSNTVTLGTGLTWGEVYKRLEMFGVMVPGARVGPVGNWVHEKKVLLKVLMTISCRCRWLQLRWRLLLEDRSIWFSN